MIGQWIGRFTESGGNNGAATLNLGVDAAPGRCFACFVQGPGLPPSRIEFSYQIVGDSFSAKSVEAPKVFDHTRALLVPVYEHPEAKNFTFSTDFTVSGKIVGSHILGTWTGSSGSEGNFDLRNPCAEDSPAATKTLSWVEFKAELASFLNSCPVERFLFRGHGSNKWHLTTTLHRIGRYDLSRYRQIVVDHLTKAVNSTLSRKYNMRDPVDFGALISLAQHHGFPTPLLDWTRSPFVAAYFAFASPAARQPGSYARIYRFAAEDWAKRLPQPANVDDPAPAVSIREFEAYDNPRHLPQQSCHTFTNVADVSAWIAMAAGGHSNDYLTTYDIPNEHRVEALRELAYMGVTASSMFPGLEGLCRGARERFFGHD